MSHTTSINNIVIQDIASLRKAVQDLNSAGISCELVENATHPVVFGDQLLNYLNSVVQVYQTHLHPGELAAGFIPVTPTPPVPPMPPPTPALLSHRVKTG